MSETAYLIIAVTSLATAVVTLWMKNDRLHKKYAESSNENLLKMTNAVNESARSNEHLANAIDDLKAVVVSRKK